MLSLSHYLVVLLGLLIFLTVFPLRRRRRLVAKLRGPPRPSLLLGHEWQLRNQIEKPGDLEMQWSRQYGGAYRVGGCFGQDVLILSDPKALQYIFHTSGYRFPKTADSDLAARSLFGQGMVTVAGKIHQRQRKVLNPAFSAAQLHRYLILFQSMARKLTDRLKSDIKINGNDEKVVDVLEWVKRIALDIIGITSFRYHFNALDDGEEQAELKDTLHNLIIEAQTSPSSIELLYPALWRILPEFASDILEGIPLRVTRRFHRFRESSQRVARGIFQKQLKVAAQDEEKDIVNLLALSYLNQDAKKRMSDDEIYSQLATFIFAGHDTTSNTTSWLLYELSRHPDVQRRIRHEISEMRERDPSSSDYDSMPILNAAIKETLRFHPFIATLNRISSREDVLPLSEPVIASDGSVMSEIPIPKGQVVVASIYIYNRLPSVWGEDADKWNPDRFLQPQRYNQTPLGVYANLMSFSAGIRSCIGWKFAVLEMQVILTELLSSFEFSLPEEGFEVMHAFGTQAISPVVKGKTKEGEQVPLCVTVCKL